jgi:hypothetical protein
MSKRVRGLAAIAVLPPAAMLAALAYCIVRRIVMDHRAG